MAGSCLQSATAAHVMRSNT